jgi:response regulator of citrate/malate metabolism
MKTIIIDPTANPLVRKQIERNPEAVICGCYASGNQVMETVSALKPDMVFLNLDIPEGGLALLEQLAMQQLVVVAASEWQTFAYDAMSLGAVAYVVCPEEERSLQAALTKAFACVSDKKIKMAYRNKKKLSD